MRDRILNGIVRAAVAPRAMLRSLRDLQRRADDSAMLLGGLHAERIAELGEIESLAEAEFKVYSQWGEDGIIEYLVARTEIPNRVFIEFGVQDYAESNTRFLLKRRNWTGLVLDSSDSNIARIRKDPISEMFDIRSVGATVTAENINALIAKAGIKGDIGLLSVDIDGNDYWVWKAINVVSPRIVVCEYNSVFGNEHAITVPYDPAFARTAAHYSKLFFGASLTALQQLAIEKSYVFVGCNSNGVNAFFVRSDCASRFARLAESAHYVQSKFRESRNQAGRSTFLSGSARLALIEECEVYELRSARTVRIRDLDKSSASA